MARTIAEFLTITADFFRKKGIASPRLDAELLLGEVLNLSRIQLYTHFDQPLTEREIAAFRDFVRRRGQNEPIAYILGRREFFGRAFKVTKDTLIPQPDTEILVETAISLLKKRFFAREKAADPKTETAIGSDGGFFRLADLGTGTGAIAVTIALELGEKMAPDRKNQPAEAADEKSAETATSSAKDMPFSFRVTATDISPAAISVAKENAVSLGAGDLIDFRLGDLTRPLAEAGEKYAAIIANPPYIRRADLKTLPPEVRAEPILALDGGEDGLDFYRRLVNDCPPLLDPVQGGFLAVEIGADQADAVIALAKAARWSDRPAYAAEKIMVRRDLAGLSRVVVLPLKTD